MDFTEWLAHELDERGWSRREAARRARVSASMFDKVLNGYAKPGMRFLDGVALAFKMHRLEVYEKAGIFPTDTSADDVLTRMAAHLVKSYKYDETRQRALDYLEFLASQEDKQQSNAAQPPKKVSATQPR